MTVGERISETPTSSGTERKFGIRIALTRNPDHRLQVSTLPLWSHELLLIGQAGLSIHTAQELSPKGRIKDRVLSLHAPHGETLNHSRWTYDDASKAAKRIIDVVGFLAKDKDIAADKQIEITKELLAAKAVLARFKATDVSYPPV